MPVRVRSPGLIPSVVSLGLRRRGVPTVIAMQAAVSDDASSILTSHFYDALANGYPVDSSLAEARKAIYVLDNSIEWGVPVLFMRTTDGRIFDIEQPNNQEQKTAQLMALMRVAQTAADVEEWGKCIDALKKLLSLNPVHAEAQSMLKRAVQQQQLPDLYARGANTSMRAAGAKLLTTFDRCRGLAEIIEGYGHSWQQARPNLNKRKVCQPILRHLCPLRPPGGTQIFWIGNFVT